MELQIRTNGTRVTDGMREFIERRMSKLDRLAENVTDAHIEFRTETTRTGAEYSIAQITLHTGRHILRAEERDTEPARAADAAIDKLISQVRRFHDKKKSRKRRVAAPAPAETGVLGSLDSMATTPANGATDSGQYGGPDEDDTSDTVVRTKRFAVKPMTVEEAIDQMELLAHDFFLFHNADEQAMNVVYRRRDGSYGLLQPTA